MRLLKASAATLLALTTLAPAARAAADDEHARLMRGETIVKSIKIDGMNGIEASFFARAPLDVTYRVLTDYEHLPDFMPEMKECVVLQRGEGYAVLKMVGDGGELTQRRSVQPPDQISWTLIHSVMLRNLKGYWHLTPAEGGTVLHYGLALVPKVPLPGNVVAHFQQQKLPPLVANVRARVESGGKWTKPEFGR